MDAFIDIKRMILLKSFYPYKSLVFILSLCLFLSKSVQAQYESLLHKSYAENVIGIHSMYNDLIQIKDSVEMAKKAQIIKTFAKKHNDRRLELNVDFFLNFWGAFYQKQPKAISLYKLTQQLNNATNENVDFLKARSLRALAEFYWKIEKNYELAFEQYIILDKELATIKAEEYPEMARDFMQIGESYYYFQDYSQAKKYFQKAIKIPENSFNSFVINASRNNLGLCYRQQSELDSSDYYFKEVLKTTFPEAQPWKRIIIGNLGGNLYLRKQYKKATPLLETDFREAVSENDLTSAVNTAIKLADIYRKSGNIQQAQKFLHYAQKNIKKLEYSDALRSLYPAMSKWYADIGNVKQAEKYIDSTIWALNRYNEKFSALKLVKAQQKVSLQEKKLQLTAIALENQEKQAEKLLLIFLILLLSIALLLIYFIQKKKQLLKDMKFQKAAQELKEAQNNLNRFTERIQEKNKLINQLEQKLDKNTENQKSILLRLQKSTILTEENWQDFKELFEQVHSGFIYRLKEKYPSFSPAEIRFLSLAKLNFSTKEMAVALGVSPQSIRTYWYRIRKKLSMSEELTVEELIMSI